MGDLDSSQKEEMEGLHAASSMTDPGSSSLDMIFNVEEDPDPDSLKAAMQVPITVWLGPVGPLLWKLHGQSLASDLLSPGEIRFLKVLCISLKDMSEDEEASFTVQWWKKMVRELCYDTDDHLDYFQGHHNFSAELARAKNEILVLIARAKDASERRKCFKWFPKATKFDLTSIGGRSTVGVHVELPNRLVELLALDDDKKTLKVIPINGCAGVGKTTVARTLYHKHGGKFQCQAFVTVSRNPYMRGFLVSMLSQIKGPRPHGLPDVPKLIDAINKHLQGKRYFIVIDDLWTASVWNIIRRAFPRGDSCSRIITTTQVDDVALACCSYYSKYIYKMELLNDIESRNLFFSRVFGSEDSCPEDFESRKLFFGRVFGSEDGCPEYIEQVSSSIIRKCDGLPLAIVNIASLLANEFEMENWKHVHDSLLSYVDKHVQSVSQSVKIKDMHVQSASQSVRIKDVLNLIYNSLPPRMRTCLLYLSMYAQGYVIKRDELVKHWVVEGFLRVVEGQDMEEIAEAYFDELVCRGMVQAVNVNCNGKVLSCSVHHMVLDFIRHKSREENLVITVDYNQSTIVLPEKVRRLSVQFGGVKSAYIPESIVTSHVRSLLFWGFFKCLPSSFMDYGLLRILILHIWADEHNESLDLTGIRELFLLKYLEVECNITVRLPDTDEIRWLQRLETLKLHAKLVAFPSDMVLLERLLHLRLLSEYILPSLVAHMTSLHTLGYFDISTHSGKNVLHLGRLTNLQDLQLICSMVQPAENLERNVQLLGSILENLTVLQSLTLVPAATGSSCVNIPRDGFNMVSPHADLLLQRIKLSRRCCIFFSLPKWFEELRNLCILNIAIRELSGEDTDILKKLSALIALTLYIQKPPAGKIFMDGEGFQVLAHFKFMCAQPCMSFAQGAMPKVQTLKLGFNSSKMEPHTFETVGLRHLTGLTEVCVKFGVQDAEEFNINDAESELEAAIRNHPNTPVIKVQRVDVISYGQEDQSTATEELEGKRQEIQEGKKRIMEGMDEQQGNRQEIQLDKIIISKIPEAQDENRLEINADKKKISEFSVIQDGNKLDIQQDKKKITEHLEEHLNKQVDSRYARTDRVYIPLTHHAQSLDLEIGAMGSLLGKLEEVIKKEYKLQKGVKKKVKSFSAELDIMRAALGKVAEVPRDQLDEQLKLWANDIRELSYDMEDVVDSLLVRVEGCEPNADQSNLKKVVTRFKNLFKKGKAYREISTAVEEIHQQLQDLTSRHKMFDFANLPAAKKTTLDPFLGVLYGDKKNIIGLEEATADIINKISDGDDVSKAQLKILSIVGFGGLGKTTLAREVYDALKTKFDYTAFVSVSRNPDMKKVLSDLLFKLDKKTHTSLNAANLNEEQLIILVRELLSKKRYFIIIDDLWDKQAWKKIRYALKDDKCGSIIITTTRHVNISEECCSSKEDMIHKMKPLSDDDSQKLFYGRIFSSEACRSGFEDVSTKILKKCAGVPLAIISLASYLANNRKNSQIDQWYFLLNSIGRGLKKGDDHVTEMKRILSLSFNDLPSYLKTCFLYLSIFPEGCRISRDRLIRKWISEGFIQVEDETTSLLELGDSYFNELINRNMIMPTNIHDDGRVEACCVHDIMLDLICELTSEENFVTILDDIKGDTPLKKKFRRLSLQKSMIDHTTGQMATTSMSQVRSFTAFSPGVSKIPPLSRFQVLRVLDLEGCDLRKSPGIDLRHVENLLHLRYLGLRGTKVGKLPMEIGKLQFLQTLDLLWTNSEELPSSVVQLRNLMCLILDFGMPLPNGFSNLTCLEQLTVQQRPTFFYAEWEKELGCLSRLRELAFQWEQNRTDQGLVESLCKLRKLESLEISVAANDGAHLMQDWVPSPNLRRFKFDGYFKTLPTWICSYSLPLLCYLDLYVENLRLEDIQILGMLPALRYVNIDTITEKLVKGKLELSAGAFPSARVCLFNKMILVHPKFQPGAMPMVQRLRFGLRVNDVLSPDFDLSIMDLHSLRQLRIDLDNKGCTPDDYSQAVDALKRVADSHPKSPTLRVDKF